MLVLQPRSNNVVDNVVGANVSNKIAGRPYMPRPRLRGRGEGPKEKVLLFMDTNRHARETKDELRGRGSNKGY